jgi:hypothetical protein
LTLVANRKGGIDSGSSYSNSSCRPNRQETQRG